MTFNVDRGTAGGRLPAACFHVAVIIIFVLSECDDYSHTHDTVRVCVCVSFDVSE